MAKAEEPAQSDELEAEDEGEELDFDWLTEEWVPAAEAIRETVNLYDAILGDRERSIAKAVAAIRRRLDNRTLWARAPRWSASLQYEEVADELSDLFPGYYINEKEADLISWSFWHNLAEAEKWQLNPPDSKWVTGFAELDWIAGDCEFHLRSKVEKGPMKAVEISGHAIGLCFNRTGLPATVRIKSGHWINSPARVIKRGPGRPRHSGGWREADAPLVEKMRQLMADNPGVTAFFAAGVFASEAAGNAGLETKQRRLWKRFSDLNSDRDL